MSRVSQRAAYYHDLAVLLEAGIPIIRSLDTVTSGLEGSLKKVFADVRKSVSEGETISDSMAKHKKAFGKLDVLLVHAAEISGSMPECFRSLTDWYEFLNRLHRKMKAGLILPILILNIAAFVVPLPGMVMGNLTLGEYFFSVFSVLATFYMSFFMLFVIYKLMRSNRVLNQILDILLLRIPVLGKALLQLSICRFCRAFNMLYKAGVPITESLTQATELAGNTVVSGLFKGGAINAVAGNAAWEGFSKRLPPEYINLWQIGEETGELEKTVDKIAEISGDSAYLLLSLCARWFPIIIYALICIWMILKIFEGYANIYSMRDL
jgi:type II secretory pathway component PulF